MADRGVARKYRKRPVGVVAEPWRIVRSNWAPEGAPSHPFVCRRLLRRGWWIETVHGWSPTQPGDYIIPEPDGLHHYPVRPDIFEATYEMVEE